MSNTKPAGTDREPTKLSHFLLSEKTTCNLYQNNAHTMPKTVQFRYRTFNYGRTNLFARFRQTFTVTALVKCGASLKIIPNRDIDSDLWQFGTNKRVYALLLRKIGFDVRILFFMGQGGKRANISPDGKQLARRRRSYKRVALLAF